MRTTLIAFCAFVLVAMIAVSVWATQQQDISVAIRDLLAQPARGNNPWFVATLFDTYFGFAWFWLWVAYKETAIGVRLLWLVLIALLGNIAMAVYVLLQLWRLPPDARAADLLLRRA